MEFRFAHKFQKQFKKLPIVIQDRFLERLDLLVVDPTNPVLRVHPLQGTHAGYWSINIIGDIRALYRKDSDTLIIFALIGTHSQLYG